MSNNCEKKTYEEIRELLPILIGSFCRGLSLNATLPYSGGHHTLLPLSDRKFTCQTYGYFLFLLFCFSSLHIPLSFRCNPFRATGYVGNYFKKNFKNVKQLYPSLKKQGFSRLFIYKRKEILKHFYELNWKEVKEFLKIEKLLDKYLPTIKEKYPLLYEKIIEPDNRLLKNKLIEILTTTEKFKTKFTFQI